MSWEKCTWLDRAPFQFFSLGESQNESAVQQNIERCIDTEPELSRAENGMEDTTKSDM